MAARDKNAYNEELVRLSSPRVNQAASSPGSLTPGREAAILAALDEELTKTSNTKKSDASKQTMAAVKSRPAPKIKHRGTFPAPEGPMDSDPENVRLFVGKWMTDTARHDETRENHNTGSSSCGNSRNSKDLQETKDEPDPVHCDVDASLSGHPVATMEAVEQQQPQPQPEPSSQQTPIDARQETLNASHAPTLVDSTSQQPQQQHQPEPTQPQPDTTQMDTLVDRFDLDTATHTPCQPQSDTQQEASNHMDTATLDQTSANIPVTHQQQQQPEHNLKQADQGSQVDQSDKPLEQQEQQQVGQLGSLPSDKQQETRDSTCLPTISPGNTDVPMEPVEPQQHSQFQEQQQQGADIASSVGAADYLGTAPNDAGMPSIPLETSVSSVEQVLSVEPEDVPKPRNRDIVKSLSESMQFWEDCLFKMNQAEIENLVDAFGQDSMSTAFSGGAGRGQGHGEKYGIDIRWSS